MTLSPSAKKQLLKLALLIIGFYILARFLLLPFASSPEVERFVADIGLWGYIIVIGYTVLSHVFAPIAGSPAVFLGVTLYGPHVGMLLLYVAGLISSVINFQIANKYGRSYVRKLVGHDGMKQIDNFAAAEGREALIVSRLFGFSVFDFISYAAGLTSLKFKDYFLITALVGFIPNLVVQFLLTFVNLDSELGLTVWVASIVVAASLFGLLMKKYLGVRGKKHNKSLLEIPKKLLK